MEKLYSIFLSYIVKYITIQLWIQHERCEREVRIIILVQEEFIRQSVVVLVGEEPWIPINYLKAIYNNRHLIN